MSNKIIQTDTFTGADGDALTAPWDDFAAPATNRWEQLGSNTAGVDGSPVNLDKYAKYDRACGSDDMYAQFEIATTNTPASAENFGVTARSGGLDSDNAGGYLWMYDQGGTEGVRLRWSSDTTTPVRTDLTSATARTFNVGDIYRIEVVGDVIRGFINNMMLHETTDTTYVDGQMGGVYDHGGPGSLKNFEQGALGMEGFHYGLNTTADKDLEVASAGNWHDHGAVDATTGWVRSGDSEFGDLWQASCLGTPSTAQKHTIFQTDLGSVDHRVELTIKQKTAPTGGEIVGPTARMPIGSTTAANIDGYAVVWDEGEANEIRIARCVDGVLTYLGSGVNHTTLAETDVLAIEVEGTGATVTVRSYLNGTEQESVGDTAGSRITSGNHGGMFQDPAGTDWAYEVDDWGGGPLATPVLDVLCIDWAEQQKNSGHLDPEVFDFSSLLVPIAGNRLVIAMAMNDGYDYDGTAVLDGTETALNEIFQGEDAFDGARVGSRVWISDVLTGTMPTTCTIQASVAAVQNYLQVFELRNADETAGATLATIEKTAAIATMSDSLAALPLVSSGLVTDDGSMAFAWASMDANSDIGTAVTGWDLHPDEMSSTNISGQMWTKIANASDDTDVTLTWTTARRAVANSFVVRPKKAAATTPDWVARLAARVKNGGSSGDFTTLGFTTEAGSLLVAMVLMDSQGASGPVLPTADWPTPVTSGTTWVRKHEAEFNGINTTAIAVYMADSPGLGYARTFGMNSADTEWDAAASCIDVVIWEFPVAAAEASQPGAVGQLEDDSASARNPAAETVVLGSAPAASSFIVAGVAKDSAVDGGATSSTGWEEDWDHDSHASGPFLSAQAMIKTGHTSTSVTWDRVNTTDASNVFDFMAIAVEVLLTAPAGSLPSNSRNRVYRHHLVR